MYNDNAFTDADLKIQPTMIIIKKSSYAVCVMGVANRFSIADISTVLVRERM